MKWEEQTVTLPDTVVVSDPCYAGETLCNETVHNVLPGRYRISIELNREGRVKTLQATHEKHLLRNQHTRHEHTGSCGVDSGTLGIFGERYFIEKTPEDNWYEDHVMSWCNKTRYHVCDGSGVISEAGYGDGEYPLYTALNANNKVVSIKILFI